MGLKRLFNSVFERSHYRLISKTDYDRLHAYTSADLSGGEGRLVTDDLPRILNGCTAPTIFDLGANQGTSYRLFRTLFPQAQITCFEPDPRAYEKLRPSLEADALAQLQTLAVSDREGEIEFHLSAITEMNSILPPHAGTADAQEPAPEKVRVRSVTLDAFTARAGVKHIDLLKMDIQGAELQALEGAGRLVAEFRISCLYLELCFFSFYAGMPLAPEIIEYLRRHSYDLYGLYNFQYDRATNKLAYCDGLFVPARR